MSISTPHPKRLRGNMRVIPMVHPRRGIAPSFKPAGDRRRGEVKLGGKEEGGRREGDEQRRDGGEEEVGVGREASKERKNLSGTVVVSSRTHGVQRRGHRSTMQSDAAQELPMESCAQAIRRTRTRIKERKTQFPKTRHAIAHSGKGAGARK
ncbi:hypothetical protein C8R44DRAFT_858785 [Mycena epipterygia]|nr:hypothetical protein C8R44DRAFT_858785 [Mycena epipterygia]